MEYKPEHLKGLALQDSQSYLSAWVTPEMANALVEFEGWAFTGMDSNGEILGVAGVIMQWQNRGMAWAYLSDKAIGSKFLFVHRAVKRFLSTCYVNRIEMTVDCEFQAAHRWAKMLGFTLEAPMMKSYRPDGGDCALYARVLS